MKKIIAILLLLAVISSIQISVFAGYEGKNEAEDSTSVNLDFGFELGGAYLIEARTGKVLYAKNEYKTASPASVTKVMTLLLVCEALKAGKYSLDDTVTVSSHAASMGGSQVFLEEGERIKVEELIKSAVIASGNDASVALAELTAGSESAFVKEMNNRARKLGLKHTNFENSTGLDDTTTNHYSCAADIAVISRELIKHDVILKYSSLWQDSIRDGEFTLTNTNRLVRYYEGCNGLKTGSTDKAGFCVSATAKRGNMQLIAVIMGAETRDKRNEAARTLLDYGFANYALYESNSEFIENAVVLSGVKQTVPLYSTDYCAVIEKGKISSIEKVYEIPESIPAPISANDKVGKIIYKLDGAQIGFCDIVAKESVEKISLSGVFFEILKRFVLGEKSTDMLLK